MPKFVKGHHIGRKKGSKAKVYLSLDYWFRHMNAEWFNLTSIQRARISLEAFKALLAKVQALPQDPSASLPTSSNLADLVKQLEQTSPIVKSQESQLNNVKTESLSLEKVDITLCQHSEIEGIAIPKSDGSEEAKAVLESQVKIDPTTPNEL